MPQIIEFYTGEKPKLKNIQTWHCSAPDHLAYVLEHLDELVVKEVHVGGYGMLVGPAASKAELARFRRKLKARPAAYIAQPTLSLSTVPVCTQRSGAAPCRFAPLCAGIAARYPHHAGRPDPCLAEKLADCQFQSGGGTRHLDNRRVIMLGRVANNLYWMARYLERAENNARLIETMLFRRSLSQADNANDEWAAVLSLMSGRDDYDALHETCDRVVTNYWLREKTNPASVLKLAQRARQNRRIVRTALTKEAWQAINDLWLALEKSLKRPVGGHDLPQIFEPSAPKGNALVRGALDGTMLRNDIFNFIRLGMLVERGDNTARLLENTRYFLFLPSASVLHQENGFCPMGYGVECARRYARL